ncbi:transposase [Roseimicrobium sp. ORNL1]|uniref:transposase n=1 Tax=Roseimicrobium sp. ORNL1 TaxID=2711231 RepID=UPI0013E1A875|nr:transposase [Roseimicrobium sp. ORNL1]QIF00074.1 hypothetical protein G5S37_00575 [Roseimicrobium sp. ORNL1]
MDFIPYNPWEPIEVTEGNLPHWQQERRTYFVTWRTDDSIPAELSRTWNRARDAWLHAKGITLENLFTLPPETQREYHERFTHVWHDHLDRGHGACHLAKPAVRTLVEQAIRHFDNDRYQLGDFVLMPNHVHLLVSLEPAQSITKQCFSWKRFSAGRINELLGRSGTFWQPESYDHIVRTPEALMTIQNYIANNPAKAGLGPGTFTHFRREDWRYLR